MTKPIFTPEDFFPLQMDSMDKPRSQRCADIANAKIEKLMGPKIYGCKAPGDEFMTWCEQPISKDTHTAYLFNVQPIKPCEHEPARALCRDSEIGVNNIRIISIACPKCLKPCVVRQLEFEPSLASWNCPDCGLMGTATGLVVDEEIEDE